jgi:flagellar hook-associated protein 3 FlgL
VLFRSASHMRAAGTQLIGQRGDIGSSLDRIATAQQMLDTEETLLKTAFNDITARDQFEAATELRELERNLEASYLLTSRLANFSLLNYLR